MRFPSFRLCVALCGLAAFAAGATRASAATGPAGMTRINVPGDTALRGDPSNRLRVVVWYPAVATATTQPLEIGPRDNVLFSEGEVALDAQPASAPLHMPFVVVSHGTGGTAMDLSWLCAGLAAHGYIVASVDHPGNNALDPQTVAGTTLWWMRANDLSRTIDGVLADSRFGPRIDRDRIGAAGFSIGGATVLILGGATTSYTQLADYCKRKPGTQLCNGESTPGVPNLDERARGLEASDANYRAAIAQGGQSHRDPRVKALFSIAPAVGPAFISESLRAMTIPVAIVAGSGDPVLPVSDNAIPDALALPNATLTLLPQNVFHYTFLTDCTSAGLRTLPLICQDRGPPRLAVHRETLALALAFFDRALAANDNGLTEPGITRQR